MSTQDRLARYLERQERAGRQRVTMFLPDDVIEILRRQKNYGELVAPAVIDYVKNRAEERP